MLVLPVTMFSALVLGFLFLRICVTEKRPGPLALLLALCALQSFIISLAQHYRAPSMQIVQPITATLIPPAAWIAFSWTAIRAPRRSDLANLAGPLCAILALITVPALLDVLIPALFAGYGAAILRYSLRGSDALLQVRLETGELPARVWTIISLALLASASVDGLIIAVRTAGASYLQPWIVSVFSAANLIIIGALSLTGALKNDSISSGNHPPDTTGMDASMDELQRLMDTERPYLDPDLTLLKLARKLGVPAKRLSVAINHTTGQNVSRYVNNARIKAAQHSLENGETVTAAMLSSGFNTKSNFNREFRRVVGMSPSEWRQNG